MALHLHRPMKMLASTKSVQLQKRSFSKFDMYGNSAIPTNKQRFVPTSGTYPKGFLISSTNVGINPSSKSQPDLVLVASEGPSCGAAAFTKNEFPAASVTVTREMVRKTTGQGLRGVIANSWCANTLTGKAGLDDALAMSNEAGKYVCGEQDPERDSSIMVMHTGMGGRRLPIADIINGIPELHRNMGNSHECWLEAARGICTTDSFPKLASRTFTVPSSPDTTFSIAGITKGAGMIHPNMATTLGIMCTDAPIAPDALQRLLSTAVDRSYNCISIDGDTSTNDMVAMLANGAAGGNEVLFNPSAASQSADFQVLQRMLNDFAADLAKLVVRDGEGATKFVTIRIRNSPSDGAARLAAAAIARSFLVKTGMYGGDPSTWGTVLAALGYSLIDTPFAGKGIIVPELTSISLVPADGGPALKCLDRGAPAEVDGTKLSEMMGHEDIEVLVDLRDDGRDATLDADGVYWTCDLTHDFITINGGFST